MSELFSGSDANLQWITQDNLVDLSAGIFDPSGIDWASQSLDGSIAPVFQYAHLSSVDSFQQGLLTEGLAQSGDDAAPGLPKPNQEALARKQSKFRHLEVKEHSDLPAIEVR